MDGFVMNARENLVRQALEGLEVSDGELVRLNRDPAFVTRADPARDEVAVISGGGSGHEPLHTGFVGRGMLHAAVPGEVFASPTALQVRAAIEAADTGRGTVLVIKNYTGFCTVAHIPLPAERPHRRDSDRYLRAQVEGPSGR